MTAPTITRRWDGSVRLVFPFDAWLVENLKAEIPGYARKYAPEDRSWTISAAYAHIARGLMHDTFPDVTEDPAPGSSDRGGRRPEPPPPGDAWAVLHLRPTAPPELVDAAYRCLARLHHPDAGGDTVTMQRINGAVDVIRRTS